MTNRRAIIVAAWVLAALFGLAGVANFALGEPAGIVAGVSALAFGATAAVTASLFIAAGGWSRDEAPGLDSDQRVRVQRPQRARERR
jgi:TM2 domain-containing membrane protein YozV